MNLPSYDIVIVGSGIFGLTAAIELRKKKWTVALIDQGTVPNPLAASTDISKVVRMEYGSDEQYMDMANESIDGWHDWNDLFKTKLYFETGFLLLCKQPMEMESQSFELESFLLLEKKGFHPQRIDPFYVRDNFPAINHHVYGNGFFHARGGYAVANRTLMKLLAYARELGVAIIDDREVEKIDTRQGKAVGVTCRNGERLAGGHIVICAGAATPNLVPDLAPYMRSTGHPVFHVRPSRSGQLAYPHLPVYAADISNSGWYGFPLHPEEQVCKVGCHGKGNVVDPVKDERIVGQMDLTRFRQFLEESFPILSNDPVVYTRCCLYCDTVDGHFWIDRHHQTENLTIAAGGSGHAFKMAPVLGRLIANAVSGDTHPWMKRFRRRDNRQDFDNQEEARSAK